MYNHKAPPVSLQCCSSSSMQCWDVLQICRLQYISYIYMCVYIYICICIYVYVYMYMCICVYMYMYICICIYVYVYMYMYISICICICVCVILTDQGGSFLYSFLQVVVWKHPAGWKRGFFSPSDLKMFIHAMLILVAGVIPTSMGHSHLTIWGPCRWPFLPASAASWPKAESSEESLAPQALNFHCPLPSSQEGNGLCEPGKGMQGGFISHAHHCPPPVPPPAIMLRLSDTHESDYC